MWLTSAAEFVATQVYSPLCFDVTWEKMRKLNSSNDFSWIPKPEGMCCPSFSQEKYTGLSPDVIPQSTWTELPSTKSIGNEKPAIFGGSEKREKNITVVVIDCRTVRRIALTPDKDLNILLSVLSRRRGDSTRVHSRVSLLRRPKQQLSTHAWKGPPTRSTDV